MADNLQDNRGGYQQPTNPAPVSGPGALSKRTDGGAVEGMQPATQSPKYMPDLGYGKGKENMDNQQAADLAGNPTPNVPTAVPLAAPTRRPEESIFDGVDFNPAGRGSEAITVPNLAISPSHTLRVIAQNDPTGDAELMYRSLQSRGL
jgi:hypothetical protein